MSWKRLANYSLIENSRLDNWINRVSHIVMTWFVVPTTSFIMLFFSGSWIIKLTSDTLKTSIYGGLLLLILLPIYYKYYVPKGSRIYFNIFVLVPTVVALLLSISCITVYFISGYSK